MAKDKNTCGTTETQKLVRGQVEVRTPLDLRALLNLFFYVQEMVNYYEPVSPNLKSVQGGPGIYQRIMYSGKGSRKLGQISQLLGLSIVCGQTFILKYERHSYCLRDFYILSQTTDQIQYFLIRVQT